METSTLVIAAGAVVFVLPVPGTFVLGAATVALGLVARRSDWF